MIYIEKYAYINIQIINDVRPYLYFESLYFFNSQMEYIYSSRHDLANYIATPLPLHFIATAEFMWQLRVASLPRKVSANFATQWPARLRYWRK